MAEILFEGGVLSVADCENGGDHKQLLEQVADVIYGGNDPYRSDLCEKCGKLVEMWLERGIKIRLVG